MKETLNIIKVGGPVVEEESSLQSLLMSFSRIRGNKIRLARAVINLVNNAFEVVDRETGRIDISVENPEPETVSITVRDNGRGISPEVIDKIFDIGYSGKQSTGLGLAFTKQVIENHQGTIRIDSKEGEYTEARVSLPVDIT